MERRKVDAMEKTTPKLPSSSSEVKVQGEPPKERTAAFNSLDGQPWFMHICDDALLPHFSWNDNQVPRPQQNFCQQDVLPEARLKLNQDRELMQEAYRQLPLPPSVGQPGVKDIWNIDAQMPHIWNDAQMRRPQHNFCQHDDMPQALLQQVFSQHQFPTQTYPHLDSHAWKQLGGVPGTQQQWFYQVILEQFNTKFEEGMIKMEQRMTNFEEAILPQLVYRISELEKSLENLAGISSKDTGNTTTLVEEKLTNLTISDIKSVEGSTSEQEGYTCGEDFEYLSEE